jgi:hypothetical protein
MALDLSELKKIVLAKLEQGEIDTAVSPEDAKYKIDHQRPQREAMADVFVAMLEYLIENTDVLIPIHKPKDISVQAVGGPGPHTGTNLTPVQHEKGKLE